MSFYWIKTHKVIKRLFPKLIWDIPNNKKIVYLTFDDGPTIEVTNWVLNQLRIYESKATFFCIGKNIEQNPEIFNRIISDGHSVGNHTFNHLNGWKTPTDRYIDNSKFEVQNSRLFRPPYGKIKPNQARELRNLGYKIIMWDVLSADFDEKITPEKCLSNVILNVESGSIIVFHDSIKAFRNLEYVLPKTLQFLKKNGFECQQIV